MSDREEVWFLKTYSDHYESWFLMPWAYDEETVRRFAKESSEKCVIIKFTKAYEESFEK